MASVSLITEPFEYSPVNGDLWYRLDSASSSTTNFKYLFKVNEIDPVTGTATNRGLYKIPPRPDSFGIFSPDKILRSSTTYNLQPTISGFASAPESIVKYNVNYGFEFNPQLTWIDTFFAADLGLTFSTAHGLLVGDVILLDKDNKQLNPDYDGTASVISVPSANSIIVNKGFGASSTLEGGQITSLLRLTATSSDRFAFNGTRQYLERTTDFTTYKASNTGRILNAYYGDYKAIRLSQYETVSILGPSSSTGLQRAYVRTYDQYNNLLLTYTFSNGVSVNHRRLDYGSGTQNLTNVGVSFTNVKYYTVQFGTTASIFTNGDFMIQNYVIDSNCSIYDNFRIAWLNKNGAFNYFNFKLDSKKQINVDTKTYDRILDWNYTVGQRGTTVFSNDVKEKYTINTDWISEYEADWFQDLFYSPEVYHIDSSNNLLPIIVEDKSYEVKTYLRNQIFNITLNFTYAYNVKTQNN